MNFEDIKRKMEEEGMNDLSLPTNIKQLEKSKIPIKMVRKSMRSEIITQLVIIVIFFAFPSIMPMEQLPKGIYYILQFVTALITLMYLAKMTWFLNKTSNLSGNSKDIVLAFIHDLKLTLEVYTTAVIAGSLLLPISMATLFLGSGKIQLSLGNTQLGEGLAPNELFEKIFSLNISTTNLWICIISYLIIAAIIYFGTVKWADKLYGVHLKNLQATLKDFEL